MAEFTYIPVQTVEGNKNAILNTAIPCNKGYVPHQNGSGIVILRGPSPCSQSYYARYRTTYGANIALADGTTTISPIAATLALDGESLLETRRIVTPAAAGDYFAVSATTTVDVPRGCCFTLAVENGSSVTDAGIVPPINMQNLSLTVDRIA